MKRSSWGNSEEQRATDACPRDQEAAWRMEDEGCPNHRIVVPARGRRGWKMADFRPREFFP